MSYRIQFWSRHRGFVYVHAGKGYGPHLAKHIVLMALSLFDRKWPGTRMNEIHVTGIEDKDTGDILHVNGPWPRAKGRTMNPKIPD